MICIILVQVNGVGLEVDAEINKIEILSKEFII